MSEGVKSNTGVYCWINTETDKGIYIGGSYYNLKQRKLVHLSLLKRNKHWNKHFQRAWNKYGEKSFKFVILKICPPHDAQRWEQEYLNHCFNNIPRNEIYNESPTAVSTLGVKRTEEFKRKNREMLSRPEIRRKISKACKEYSNRLDVKETRSERMKKLWADPNFREKLLKAQKKGMEIANAKPETKKNRSEAAKKVWSRPEQRENKSIAMKEYNKIPGVRERKSRITKRQWEKIRGGNNDTEK